MWCPRWRGGALSKSSPGSPVLLCWFFWWVSLSQFRCLCLPRGAKPDRLVGVRESNGSDLGVLYFLFQRLLHLQFEAGVKFKLGWALQVPRSEGSSR